MRDKVTSTLSPLDQVSLGFTSNGLKWKTTTRIAYAVSQTRIRASKALSSVAKLESHTTCFTSTTEGNYCMHGVLCFLHHARDPNCERRNRDGAIESAVSRLPFPHTPTH